MVAVWGIWWSFSGNSRRFGKSVCLVSADLQGCYCIGSGFVKKQLLCQKVVCCICGECAWVRVARMCTAVRLPL